MRRAGQCEKIGLCILIGLALAIPTVGADDPILWVDASGPTDGVTHFQTLNTALRVAAHQSGYVTIWVAPGEYTESVSIQVTGLKLRAREGPEKTRIFGTVELLVKNVFIEGFMIRAPEKSPALSIKGHRAYLSRMIVEGSELFGIGVESADDVVLEDVTVRENKVGIWIFSGRGTKIQHSRLTANTLTGIIVAESASDCVISDSRISQNGETGIELEGVRNCEIVHNQIESNDNGLRLTQAYENIIRDNSIVQQTTIGLALDQADGNEIRENRIAGNKMGLVLQHSSGNTVKKNLFETHTDIALLLKGDAEVNTISENTLTGNFIGLQFIHQADEHAPQSNLIEHNAIQQNQIGILIESSKGGNRFLTNEITGNQADGVHMANGTRDTFISNQMSQNGLWGMRIESGAHSFLEENSFEQNGEGGLYMTQVRGLYVTRNLFSDQPLGITLEQTLDIHFADNIIRGGRLGGLRVREAERLKLIENEIIDNAGPGLDLWNVRTVYVDGNIIERNAQGGALITDSQDIDLYEDNFRENGPFDLRATTNVKNIVARRNFWGQAVEPTTIEGLEFEEFFPWLLRAAAPDAGRFTAGWILELVSGGERLDASEQNSVSLTLTPDTSGTHVRVITQTLAKQPEGFPSLEHSIKYVSVHASSIENGNVELEIHYQESELPSEVNESELRIYLLKGDQWVRVLSQWLADKRTVVGTVPATQLQEVALFALAAPSGLSANALESPTTPPRGPMLNNHPQLTKPPSSPMVLMPNPMPQGLEPNLHTWKFLKKPFAKGLIARLIDICAAVLQLDWEKAWKEFVGFFVKEEDPKPILITNPEKSEFQKGGALP